MGEANCATRMFDDNGPERSIPWELSKALSGKWKIVTRSGIEIPSVHFFEGSDITNPVCGVINGHVENWTVEGKYFSDRDNSAYNLFLEKKTVVKWVNLYRGPNDIGERDAIACLHPSEESAQSGKLPSDYKQIARAIRIEYEE